MSIHKVCLVGGSGRLGPHILRALQNDPTFDITVVTRQSSKATFPEGSNVVKIGDDYSPSEMEQVFRGHDAVVLSLSNSAKRYRNGLAQASVKAGVKRLIASGYGGNLDNQPSLKLHDISEDHLANMKYLQTLETGGWSWTHICNGLFLDFCLQVGFFHIDPKKRTAQIWDDGNNTFSATTLSSIAQAVVGVLHHPEETKNRRVYVSTTELSLNSLLAAEQRVSNTTPEDWTIEHVDSDEQIARYVKQKEEAKEFMPKMMAVGGLALAVSAKAGFEQDFKKLGRLDNELLGVPRESIEEVVARVRGQQS